LCIHGTKGIYSPSTHTRYPFIKERPNRRQGGGFMWVPVVKKLIVKPDKATVTTLKEFTGKDLITRHMSRQFVLSHVTLSGSEVIVKDDHSDRGYYILEGQLLARVGDLYGELEPGDTIFAPARMSHSISGTGKLLVVFSPEADVTQTDDVVDQPDENTDEHLDFERRFRQLARDAARGGGS
jgi:mannose-6-phosphate isomerase-like protein (cupin superfamily)